MQGWEFLVSWEIITFRQRLSESLLTVQTLGTTYFRTESTASSETLVITRSHVAHCLSLCSP